MIISYADTRIYYRIAQTLVLILIVFSILIIIIGRWGERVLLTQKNILFGDWDIVFLNIDDENISYFTNHKFIKDYSIQSIQDRIEVDDNHRLVIGSVDNNFLNLGNIKLLNGRLPKKANEVAIEKDYLKYLNVKKVGDVVPNDANIINLRGFSVCGIIEDYSERWNLVNWDIKLINCIISNQCIANSEKQIFLEVNNNIEEDIKINHLNYRENINTAHNSYLTYVIKLWGVVFFIEILLIVIIKYRIKHRINSIMISKKSIYRHCKMKKMIKFIILILIDICFIILLNKVLDNLVLDNYNSKDYIKMLNIFDQKGDGFFSTFEMSMYIKNNSLININYENNLTILFYPNVNYNLLLNSLFTILWVLLMFFIKINYILKYYVENNFLNYKNFIYNYYYGDAYLNKIIICKIFVFFMLDSFLFLIVSFSIRHNIIDNQDWKWIYLFNIFFYIVFLIPEILIIYYKFKKLKEGINQLIYRIYLE